MPGDNNNLDNSLFGEKSLADSFAAITSSKSQHFAADFDASPGDAWLQSKNFYHRYLPREDMPPVLRNGDFLVRISEIRNIVIMQKNKKWWIDPNKQLETLSALFESYATKSLVIEMLTMTNMLARELIREIMKEVQIMRYLHHTNVVGLVGVVLINHPLYILMEYVSGTALDVYLKRKHAKITKDERLAMIIGVATGMDHIHKANILHRDLAARNCLYDINNTVLIYEIFAGMGPYDDMKNTIAKKLIKEQLEILTNLHADKREGVDEQKTGGVPFAASDAITISVAGTVEIDLHETRVMKKAKKTEADITQSSAEDVELSTKIAKPQKTAKKKTIKVSLCKDPSSNKQTKNKVDRPMIEAKSAAGKPRPLEIDSRREKNEVNVKIRQKPVLG